ncbi:MAG: hypothetical protein KAJ66_05035 [Candidatus Omnitrophica bacterium]|nr:hypothetical protein [Candidatus Omnitrophota bacterium]
MSALNKVLALLLISLAIINLNCGVKEEPPIIEDDNRFYYNEKCGCSVTLPEGWVLNKKREFTGRLKIFLIQAFKPGLISNVVFTAQRNFDDEVTAEKAIKVEIAHLKTSADKNFEVISEEPVCISGYVGHQMVDEFDWRGVRVYQKRIYFVRSKYIFALVLNSTTREAYKECEPTFDKMVKSLKLPDLIP